MLVRTVGSVFITILGLDVFPSEIPRRPAGDLLTSYVRVTGDWNGAVLLECTRQQACHFAGMALSSEPPDNVDDGVRDVVGELANVIGGNMKGVMAAAGHLSLPTVIDGCDHDLQISSYKARERLTFESSEGAFWVTILIAK
jgi:CheY-specific phosphatase CheX